MRKCQIAAENFSSVTVPPPTGSFLKEHMTYDSNIISIFVDFEIFKIAKT